MISFTTRQSALRTLKTDTVVLLAGQDRKQVAHLNSRLKKLSPELPANITASSFSGKKKEVVTLFPQGIKCRNLVVVGAGKSAEVTLETIRIAAARAGKAAAATRSASMAVVVEPLGDLSVGDVAGAVTEGLMLSSYRFDKYFTEKRPKKKTLKKVELISTRAADTKQIRSGMNRAQTTCAGTILARDLANAPGNEIYPETLAQAARVTGRKAGFSVTVFDERKIRSLKMGGLIAVSKGSRKPPRFIIMKYRPGRTRVPTVVLIGKGVTFDSGGISIKPSAGMGEMKMDMAGAAAVVGTMQSATQLKLPVQLIGIIPAAENLPDGNAVKPGDVVTHYNGKTSEVDNTDAEGRLILADALSYAARYKPDLVIDLATLTGACVVALGHVAAGAMGTDQKSIDGLRQAGERTHEYVWQLPLFEEYEKLIRSDIADVRNVGGRWAGAITAALFLKKFIGAYPWIHLDIAGPAILEEGTDYIPRGGSGFGVRLIVNFLENLNAR
ncbi:MAG: leucyl aminopeptidase [Ignavibacteria bacterium]|nr:leucyl aminopeptidase [Ignavibacteria bacterium]